LFNVDVYNDHCDVLLAGEEKERLNKNISDDVLFL
jgi:hypothetical protein